MITRSLSSVNCKFLYSFLAVTPETFTDSTVKDTSVKDYNDQDSLFKNNLLFNTTLTSLPAINFSWLKITLVNKLYYFFLTDNSDKSANPLWIIITYWLFISPTSFGNLITPVSISALKNLFFMNSPVWSDLQIFY